MPLARALAAAALQPLLRGTPPPAAARRLGLAIARRGFLASPTAWWHVEGNRRLDLPVERGSGGL